MELVMLSEKTQEFLDRKLEEEARKHYKEDLFNQMIFDGRQE